MYICMYMKEKLLHAARNLYAVLHLLLLLMEEAFPVHGTCY